MRHHQANFLFLFHLVYLLSNILHILPHLYGYKHHIHEPYHLTIPLHIYHHQNVIIFLLYLLCLWPNILHIYFHQTILVFLYHVLDFHFFPILHNILHDFHILHIVYIQQVHYLLMMDILRIILVVLLQIHENFELLQKECLKNLGKNCFFLYLIGEVFFDGRESLEFYFGYLLKILKVLD